MIESIRKDKPQTIVSTNGLFDILHIGHIRYLQEAASLGTILVVGVNSDCSAKKLRGDTRPIIPQDKRMEILAAIEVVDFVVLFDEMDSSRFINEVRPDIHVKGGDYQNQDIPEKEIVEALGGRLVITDYYYDESVTHIIQQIIERYSFVDIHKVFPTIVKKDWGYEFWIHNEKICYKILVLNPGWQCSLHYHQKKCEVFTVMAGKMCLELGAYDEQGLYIKTDEREMVVGDSVHVHNRTVHRFASMAGIVVLLESSTHHEDEDTYRLIGSRRV